MKHFTKIFTLLLALATGQAAFAQLGVRTSTDDVKYEYYIPSFASNAYTLELPTSGNFFYFIGNGIDAKFIFKANDSSTGAYSLYVTNATTENTALPMTLAEEAISSTTFYSLGYSGTSSDIPTPVIINSAVRPTGGVMNVLNADDENAPVCDLGGCRVMQSTKGALYIKNGKKFLAL